MQPIHTLFLVLFFCLALADRRFTSLTENKHQKRGVPVLDDLDLDDILN